MPFAPLILAELRRIERVLSAENAENRDILALVAAGVLEQNPGGGRSTSYSVRR